MNQGNVIYVDNEGTGSIIELDLNSGNPEGLDILEDTLRILRNMV